MHSISMAVSGASSQSNYFAISPSIQVSHIATSRRIERIIGIDKTPRIAMLQITTLISILRPFISNPPHHVTPICSVVPFPTAM